MLNWRCMVFISYARGSSSEEANALRRAIEDESTPVFLDTADIDAGESVPDEVFEALLASRVVVAFADSRYFTRRYCLEELMTAVAPYRAFGRRPASSEELRRALEHLVVAVPPRKLRPGELRGLPPPVASTNWPTARQTARIAALVRSRLATVSSTIGADLESLGELEKVRERLRQVLTIPPPRSMHGVPLYHELALPHSIVDAFVGRGRELWELHTILSQRLPGSAALTASLEGAGGFGKTRLALEYLHRYGPDTYSGGIIWINADVAEDRFEAQ